MNMDGQLTLLLGRSRIRRHILELVMESPDRRMHLRGIARAVGTSAGTAARELGRLEDASLVRRTRDGNQVYFEGRPNEPNYTEIRQVVRRLAMGTPRSATRSSADPLGIAVAKLMHAGLRKLYGKRLRGVYLYGSRARGDQASDSDVDILIVLDRVGSYGEELERTSALASDLSLDLGVLISRAFASESDWRSGAKPFLVSARTDAIEA